MEHSNVLQSYHLNKLSFTIGYDLILGPIDSEFVLSKYYIIINEMKTFSPIPIQHTIKCGENDCS